MKRGSFAIMRRHRPRLRPAPIYDSDAEHRRRAVLNVDRGQLRQVMKGAAAGRDIVRHMSQLIALQRLCGGPHFSRPSRAKSPSQPNQI